MQPGTKGRFSVPLKGITFVCVPLIFELIFVLALSGLVRQAEADATAAMRSARLIELGHRLIEHSFAAAGGCEGYTFTRHPLYKDMFEQSAKGVATTLSELEHTKSSKPAQEAAKQEIIIMSQKYLGMVQRDMSLSNASDADALRVIRNSLSGEVLRMLQNRVEDFLGEEEEIRQHEFLAQAHSRHRLNQVIYIGVGCNILLAVLMTLLFGASITSRLRIMIDNTVRLQKGKPLNPTVGGNDEITQLDEVFHEMADSLKNAERLKLDFVAMVSHDLRTPLNAIQLFLESLVAGLLGQLSDKGLKHAGRAQHNVKRLLQLIKDLLDLERLESGTFELKLAPVQVSSLIETSIECVDQEAAVRSIAITAGACADAMVMVETDLIIQVLTNLLSNAIKFSSEGSQVVVSSALVDGNIRIEVADHGRGIPDELHEDIFDKFKQTQSSDAKILEGSGLGLAICKLLVTKHGGTIGVESKVGEGSTFWFALPAHRPVQKVAAMVAGSQSLSVVLLVLTATTVGLSGCQLKENKSLASTAQLVKSQQFLDEAKAELAGQAFDQAIKSATSAIELDPSDHLAYLYRGYARFKLGRPEDAIDDFSIGANLQPNDYQCFEYRAAAYQSIRRYRKAIDDYHKALNVAPQQPTVRGKLSKELGLCNLSFGKVEDAQSALSQAIGLVPEDSTLYAARAIADLHLQRPEKCIDDATIAIKLDAHNASAYYARSHAYGWLHQTALSDADDAAAKRLFAQSYVVTAQ
ncbi:MAG TPA: ATP-binding protein [Candidatus Obscuribacterales bacterium]